MVKSIDKGKRGEREAVKFLKSIGFEDARRTAQLNGLDGKSDVVCEQTLPHVHIEVKFGVKGMDLGTELLWSALEQADRDSAGVQAPVVLWKKHGGRTWILTWMDKIGMLTVSGPDDIRTVLLIAESLGRKLADQATAATMKSGAES